MKTFIFACLLLATVSAAFIPTASQQQQRPQRDVSELTKPAYKYLPPALKRSIPAAIAEATTPDTTFINTEVITEAPITVTTPAPSPSAALRNTGYEYRTVRRLKYRQRIRRDVSHLASQYLPPAQPSVKQQSPSNEYLPPTENNPQTGEAESIVIPTPKVANEYLPPYHQHELEEVVSTEAVPELTEAPAADTEAPFEIFEEVETEPTPVEDDEEVPQDTAVLAEDGYHYKQPTQQMSLLKETQSEYLPPLDENLIEGEAVGPADSAVLADDGYHYRAIKRLRFF